MDERASKLTEAAFVYEESKRAEQAREFLRQILGTFEAERNVTVSFLDGYISAMKRVMRQGDI